MEDIMNLSNVVYRITFPNGKCYIGITTQKLRNRVSGHKQHYNEGYDKLVYRAMHKYGWESIKWDILDTGLDFEDLKTKEIYWIEKLRAYVKYEDSNGYNMTLGGEGTKGLNGELNHNSKITDVDVKNIKHKLLDGCDITKLSKDYGVSKAVISSIKRCSTWRHVCPELDDKLKKSIKEKINYDINDIKEIKTDISKNTPINIISKKYGVNKRLINDIRDFKRYKDVLPNLNNIISELNWNCRLYSDDLIITIKKEMVESNQFNSMYYVRKYNISRITVSKLKLGTSYLDVGSEYNDKIKSMYKTTSFLSNEEITDIKTRLFNEESINDIASSYDIHRDKVRNIFYLKSHKNILSELNEKLLELGIIERAKYNNIKYK